MTVETYQQHQETVEADSNMLCQPKQRYDRISIVVILYQINKVNENMTIPAMEEVAHVYSCPLLECMSYDTDISDGVKK